MKMHVVQRSTYVCVLIVLVHLHVRVYLSSLPYWWFVVVEKISGFWDYYCIIFIHLILIKLIRQRASRMI